MTIEQITAYKTPDGNIFEREGEAERHLLSCRVMEAVRAWADQNCYSGMERDDVATVILENAESLKSALEGVKP